MLSSLDNMIMCDALLGRVVGCQVLDMAEWVWSSFHPGQAMDAATKVRIPTTPRQAGVGGPRHVVARMCMVIASTRHRLQ